MRIRITVLAAVAAIALSGSFAVRTGAGDAQAETTTVEYTGNVIVRFDAGVTLPEVASAIDEAETFAVASSAGSGLVLLEPEDGQSLQGAVADLQANPDVAFAEPDTVMKADLVPNDPLANNGSYNWSLTEIGAQTAWDTSTGNANVIVAVVDTGVDGTVTDLSGKLTTAGNAGKNFVSVNINDSVNAGGTARIRTTTGHSYQSGDFVTIAGHNVAAYNGSREVFVPSANISAIANASGSVRVTTSASHLLATGDIVNIRGNSALVTHLGGTRSINGDWIVTVTNATQFTLNGATYNTSGTGGQAKVASYMNLVGVAYTSGGTGGTTTADSPKDDHGHGTFVSGIVAANTNNGTGMAGVCWSCKIMPVKVLDHEGYGTSFSVSQGIDWAVSHGADVINLSLGGGGTGALQTSVNNAWTAGVVVVAATGNDNGPVSYPAAYANAIAVGSTQQGGARSSFSNFGPEIDIVAPGSSVLGTMCQCNGTGGGYGTGSGTSFSTPYVAGAAALLIASGIVDKDEIRSQLLTTATDLGTAGFDNLYGNGRLNIAAAIDVGPDTTPPSANITAPANGATLALGNVVVNAFAADAGGINKVRFWSGATYLGFDTTAPYSRTWNASGAGPGTNHVIKIEAIDNANNSTFRTITVTMEGTDATPPTASITSPADGATVSGTVAFNATASDAGGIQKVRFWAGSTYLGFDSVAPYTRNWDTSTAVAGPVTLRIEAIDNANNSTFETIVVTKTSTDVTPPTVTGTTPVDGATVSGVVTLSATATDAGGLQKLRFWVDSTYLGYDSTSPYQRTWNTTALPNGDYVVKVQAVDLANNESVIYEVTVTVAN